MPKIGFEQVIGQRLAVSHLQNAVRTGRVSQAYLISGEKGAGKMKLALAFAAALLCAQPKQENGGPEPCGECHSCVQIQAGSHPDVVLLTNERVGAATKTGTLGVALARFVQADVSVKPYYGPYKIYIIPNAENLNQQAQNALLKTLEEPPAYAVFLLLAQNTSVFLPTVLCILHRRRILWQHLRQQAFRKTKQELQRDFHTGIREDAWSLQKKSFGSSGRSRSYFWRSLQRRTATEFCSMRRSFREAAKEMPLLIWKIFWILAEAGTGMFWCRKARRIRKT